MLSTIALTAILATAAHAAPCASCSYSSSSGPQVPFTFPLSNGFPNISIPSAALTQIEQAAHGTLPNTPLPTNISDASFTAWQNIALNELWEVAFFTSMINNITNNIYPDVDPATRNPLLETLQTIQAQEELHTLGANAILASAKRATIQPCQYIFPTTTLAGALDLASEFTDLVLGSLQDVLIAFSTDTANKAGFLPLIGSVIGQEGEQNGFYRLTSQFTSNTRKVPSALPFLTRSSSAFLFSYINQHFIVPGSCPNFQAAKISSGSLILNNPTPIQPVDQTFSFTFNNNGTDPDSMGVAFVNQQNAPVVKDLGDVETQGNKTTFSVDFPYQEFEMNGLTIVAITSSKGPFASADDVAEATIFGPALVEVN